MIFETLLRGMHLWHQSKADGAVATWESSVSKLTSFTLHDLKELQMMERYMRFNSHVKTLVKSMSWRLVGAIDTFVLAFFITGHMGLASSIMGFEVFTKTALYYGHERIWETFLNAFFAK